MPKGMEQDASVGSQVRWKEAMVHSGMEALGEIEQAGRVRRGRSCILMIGSYTRVFF